MDLLHLLFALDEMGCLRINTDGEHIYAYFKYAEIPNEIREGLLLYRRQLLQQLRHVNQDKKEKEIHAKGVLII